MTQRGAGFAFLPPKFDPNSAKYGRGIPGVKLQKRTDSAGDGIHRFQLKYGGPLGDWTLTEALAE